LNRPPTRSDSGIFSLENARYKLGKHEMISALEIRDALPRTAVGKLSKKELYDEETRKRAAQK
jgi:acyl-CoA synthetase (AMP-forming)/AMP-acid ligase II